MLKTLFKKLEITNISLGTKIVTKATAIRWAGWGFAENLIPIFLFSFATSYAEAGLIKSIYEIAMIITFPIFGILADRFRATTLIMIGMSMYVIVGTSYLLAGITGMAIFILIARFFNGIGFGLDAVGREAYFRRHNPPSHLATVFGYFDSIAILWWILASIVGIFLVKYFDIHWLLFLIVPTVLLALFIIWKWNKKIEPAKKPDEKLVTEEKRNFIKSLIEFSEWNYRLKIILLLNLVLSASWSIIIFFLPINMYATGASYTTIILFGISASIPYLFGMFFGKIFDKSGPRLFVYGLLLYGILLILLGISNEYSTFIFVAFFIGLIQEFVSVGKEEIITVYTKPEHFGRIGGIMRSIMTIGAMVGPLIAGITMDATGNTKIVYIGLSICMFITAIGFAIYGRVAHKQKTKNKIHI